MARLFCLAAPNSRGCGMKCCPFKTPDRVDEFARGFLREIRHMNGCTAFVEHCLGSGSISLSPDPHMCLLERASKHSNAIDLSGHLRPCQWSSSHSSPFQGNPEILIRFNPTPRDDYPHKS